MPKMSTEEKSSSWTLSTRRTLMRRVGSEANFATQAAGESGSKVSDGGQDR